MSSEKNFGYLGNTFQIQLINQLILNKDFARAIVDVLDSKYFDNQYFKSSDLDSNISTCCM